MKVTKLKQNLKQDGCYWNTVLVPVCKIATGRRKKIHCAYKLEFVCSLTNYENNKLYTYLDVKSLSLEGSFSVHHSSVNSLFSWKN